MKMFVSISAILLATAILALLAWRILDHRHDQKEISRLMALQPKNPRLYSNALVSDLPAPAQRYFAFAIREGTPLWKVADISMQGKFSLGTKEMPNYMEMTARQVLAAPHGFIWKMSAKSGLMRVSGSDSATWTRFWLAGLFPVARAGGNADHARSAFGRSVSEALFWTPAALLPGPGVSWEAVDDTRARVTIRSGALEQMIELSVDAEGKPVQVVFPRWTDANPDKLFRVQPFGGHLSGFRDFQGYRLPTHVEAGNDFGTDNYFPFFIADVRSLTFPKDGDTPE